MESKNCSIMKSGRKDSGDLSFLQDMSLLGGIVALNIAFDKARPYLIPLACSLGNKMHPHWIQIRENTVYIVHGLKNVVTFLSQSRRGKCNLVRWLGSNLPVILFPANQRIRIWTKTSDEEPIFDTEDERRPLVTSFRCLPHSLIGDLDIGDANSTDDIFVAFKRSSETDMESETDTDTGEIDATGSGTCWGTTTNFSMNFSQCDARCSTPKNAPFGYSGTGKYKDVTFTVQEESSTLAQAMTDAKVVALEAELNAMKAMLALILENQSKNQIENPTGATTISHDHTLVPNLQSVAPKVTSTAPLPPPPPPPPPPMPAGGAAPTSIKLKVGSGGLTQSAVNDDTLKPKGNHPPSLTDVLKALPNVKLRQIPRSPGGTPLKQKKKSDPSDLGSVMAAALRKRYARIQSPISSEGENDSYNEKENLSKNESEDSFGLSPSLAFYKPPVKLLKSPAGDSILIRGTSIGGKRASAICDFDSEYARGDALPLFGQHLLKRRLSTPPVKHFGLRERSLNSQN